METLLFPSSPPSSPSSPSIVATLPFVPDADRTTALGRAENRPGCAVQPVGYQILIGDVPLAPHRVAIPGTVPFRNRVASFGAVSFHLRVASSDAGPFPRRTGSQDLVLPPHRAGPLWVGSGVNGGWVVSPIPPAQGQTSSANHPSGSPTCRKSPPPAAGKLDLWIGVVLLADKKREAEIPGGPTDHAAHKPVAPAAVAGGQYVSRRRTFCGHDSIR
jgi:hypothetical protein